MTVPEFARNSSRSSVIPAAILDFRVRIGQKFFQWISLGGVILLPVTFCGLNQHQNYLKSIICTCIHSVQLITINFFYNLVRISVSGKSNRFPSLQRNSIWSFNLSPIKNDNCRFDHFPNMTVFHVVYIHRNMAV